METFFSKFGFQRDSFITDIFGSVRTAGWSFTNCPLFVPMNLVAQEFRNFNNQFY
jgi:hypothetical protein